MMTDIFVLFKGSLNKAHLPAKNETQESPSFVPGCCLNLA